jgi:hypothetical protein
MTSVSEEFVEQARAADIFEIALRLGAALKTSAAAE